MYSARASVPRRCAPMCAGERRNPRTSAGWRQGEAHISCICRCRVAVQGTKTCVRYHARVIRPTVAHVSFLLLALAAVPAGARQPGTALPAPGDVLVILWFDTEDYLLPASDDAAGRVAEILSARGVRSTFKVVGEKARVLERRGRRDVIAALKRHDIGYHSNTHSQQPTIAVYLQNAGWEEGRAEFRRREAQGRRDVERIFGRKPSAYGQPGSAWAAQAYPALRDMGI